MDLIVTLYIPSTWLCVVKHTHCDQRVCMQDLEMYVPHFYSQNESWF